jgi:Flp pilus assembly pilin Flp
VVNNIILSGMAWVSSIKDAIAERISEERGQDLIEYAVLAGGIGIALFIVFLAAPGLGASFTTFKNKIAACVTFNATSCTT